VGVCVLLAFSLAAFAQTPPLAPKYAKFLDDVGYISTTKERDVFRKLESDQDRDRFLEEFWAQRDPTPGTPRNELKEEHYRRMEFADKTFGRGTPFKGSKTERGRIYIILGPPFDVERIMSSDAYPMEIWSYTGIASLRQTSYLRLLFYQRMGVGDFVIYNPLGNSPKELVGNPRRVDITGADAQGWDEWDKGAYLVLKQLVSLDVAGYLVPGAQSIGPRMQASMLLAEAQRYPQSKVNDDYVVAILEHKPKVAVSYSVKFMGNRTAMALAEDPAGNLALHYVLVPDQISFDTYGDKYVADLKTTVRLTDLQGRTIYQQDKMHAVELHKDEMAGVRADSFQFYDSIPIIPGRWSLSLLLENTVSCEFTTIEKDISVPARDALQMSPLVLCRKVFLGTSPGGASRAFQFGPLQLYPSVYNFFREKDRIFAFTQLLGLTPAARERTFIEMALLRDGHSVWSARKAIKDYPDARFILEEIPSESLTAGSYSVRAVLEDDKRREILSTETGIGIVKEKLPGIWVAAQTNPPAGDPSYDFIRGTQYLNAGEIEKGAAELARAHEKKRDSVEYAVGYARALLATKSAAKAREVLLPLVESPGAGSDLFEALNALGECYLEMGDKDLAVKAFSRSLEVNPNQPRIKEIVKGIKRELN
jgi:GWxTD domain-containing protein